MILWDGLVFIFGGTYYQYDSGSVHCYYDVAKNPVSSIDNSLYNLTIGGPSLVTFISFVLFIFKLFKKTQVSKMDKKKYRAAVTITLFTALFLVCNFPCLSANILWFLKLTDLKTSGELYGSTFMFFYSWLIADIVCLVLNAALNPVLYFCRMRPVREWVSSSIRRTTSSQAQSS